MVWTAKESGGEKITITPTPPVTTTPSPTPTPTPGAGAYYSQPSTPYIEIKDTSPDGEIFEAMAGVPTTQNLYVGFGATEFITSIEVEEKKSTGQRIYTFTYTCSQCTEIDEKCILSCSGHSISQGGCGALTCTNTSKDHSHSSSCYCNSGNSASGVCSSGPITLSAKCKCGAVEKEQTFSPSYNPSSCEGHVTGTTYGCVHTQKINHVHPHSHVWKGTVTQPIEEFHYSSITGLELWKTNRLILEGNVELFKNPNQVINPNTGYRAFYNQEGYTNGNGRLIFSFNYNDSHKYGNTNESYSNDTKMLKVDCDTAATDWMNSMVSGKTTNATVVSDFLSLTTTEGYQTLQYHTYKSDTVPITTQTFTTGSESKSITGEPVTFSGIPMWEEFWDNNTNTAANWKPTNVTRSGYNGNYSSPSSKYINSNVVTSSDPTLQVLELSYPNTTNAVGSTSFVKGSQNHRMTYKGLRIINSTDANRNWSATDSIEPVHNGVWETGECYIELDKVIGFKTTEGTVWSDDEIWGTSNGYGGDDNKLRRLVTYSPKHNGVNDIVIHNPVSVQNVTVISNDKKYDLRTESSLAVGGDPVAIDEDVCPRDASCAHSFLDCHISPSVHSDVCYTTIEVGTNHIGGYNSHEHTSDCFQGKRYEWTHSRGCTYEGQTHISTSSVQCSVCGHSCGSESIREIATLQCKNTPNKHVCTSACTKGFMAVLSCDDPHHYAVGQPWSPTDPKNHYDFGDSRCYSYCDDDSKHKKAGPVVLPNGSIASNSDIFINLDRELTLYYPSTGDFAQQPNLHGIGSCTDILGMGYIDNMDTTPWIREKYVMLPVNVIAENNQSYVAGEPIDLLEISEGPYYKFYVVLANDEQVNAGVQYVTIANNAEEEEFYIDNYFVTNRKRYYNTYSANHTASKYQYIDVVGYIGSLTINDTGDFRFATLFKQLDSSGGWLIENLVPRVNYKLPNKIVSDKLDVRGEVANASTQYQDAYGTLKTQTGGKAFEFISLPLLPSDNPILSLRNQEMRPGYKLFMDVGTVGNYYGENYDDDNNPVDSDMYYKLQITPRYWNLNLDTGVYTPLDVYMGVLGEYVPVVLFDGEEESEYLYYLDWLEESARRNYTNAEKAATNDVTSVYSINQPAVTSDYSSFSAINRQIRSPKSAPDVIGTAKRLFLNDLNRTFIGSDKTYGVSKNPQSLFSGTLFQRQAQRWHFTLGLPSSSVFVPAGSACTETNIKAIQNQNSVIVCSIGIIVRGEVWSLKYQGKAINQQGLIMNGKTYNPPVDPKTGKSLEDPIIVVYSNDMTSKDDLKTEGTH